ncbi:MAG TPA: putative 2-aminoethylphosphonate ABC transporter ATP-binding protein, partial [Sulfurospirillum cavolei]
AAKLLIRPEDIKLYDAEAENIIEGIVLKMTFLGSFCRLFVSINGLLENVLLLDLPHKLLLRDAIREQSPIKLAIAPKDIRYFLEPTHA